MSFRRLIAVVASSSNPDYLLEEGKEVVNASFVDYKLFKQKTWWSYREMARVANRGWRIDYICVTPKLLKKVKSCEIWDDIEGSDHCPVVVELK